MTVDLPFCISRLEANAGAIHNLVENVDEEQARWRPEPGKWSILEVVNHLRDEEGEDFRARLEHVLRGTEGPWPPIDPQGWAESRGYNERDLQESIEGFLAERRASLAWLKSLDEPDWSAAYNHPSFGPIAACNLLGSWVAHDYLHLRQLTRLQYQYIPEKISRVNLLYAGEW